jgi:hypothetical protein
VADILYGSACKTPRVRSELQASKETTSRSRPKVKMMPSMRTGQAWRRFPPSRRNYCLAIWLHLRPRATPKAQKANRWAGDLPGVEIQLGNCGSDKAKTPNRFARSLPVPDKWTCERCSAMPVSARTGSDRFYPITPSTGEA